MAQETIECPLYKPKPGEKIRILVEYGDSWRPIFWFEVRRDGSVYLGPRYTALTELRHGIKRLDGNLLQISYADGVEITDPNARKGAKLSLHASGVINTPAGRLARPSLRSLSDHQLLCGALFQHPSAFAAIDGAAVRKRDVRVRYPIDEARPLWCQLYAAPKEQTRLVKSARAVFQVNHFFEYRGLEGTPDLVLQLVLGHGVEGPWPPTSYLTFPILNPKQTDAGC